MPELKAGAAKTVITPPTGYRMGQWGLRQGRSIGVHRDLYARALVLDDGDSKVAIVSLEVCGFPLSTMQEMQRRVNDLTGIPAASLIVNSTHNHTALANALRNGVIAGAAVDSVYPEPLPADSELWDLPNLLITPHIAGNAEKEMLDKRTFDIFAENLGRYVAGQPLINVVDKVKQY